MNHSESRKYEMSATMDRSDVFFMKITESRCSIPFHWHNGIELLFNISGKIWVILKDRTIELNEGEFFLINIGILHATKSTPGNIGILLELPIEFLKKYIPDVESCYYDINPHTPDPKIQTKLDIFHEILTDMDIVTSIKPEDYMLRFNSLVFEMLFQLQHNFRIPMPERKTGTQQKSEQRLSALIEYVYSHYHEPISIQEASDYVHLQPQYFCRFFKKNMGMSFLTFVNDVRLYYVYQEIMTTNLPIGQIVTENGFTNYATFRKLFDAKFHCTPKDLRKTHPDIKMDFLMTENQLNF